MSNSQRQLDPKKILKAAYFISKRYAKPDTNLRDELIGVCIEAGVKKDHKYKPERGSQENFLCSMMVNECIDYLRKNRIKTVPMDYTAEYIPDLFFPHIEDVDNEDFIAKITNSEIERKILLGFYYKNHASTIAKSIGTTTRQVYAYVQRNRKKWKEAYNEIRRTPNPI